MDRRSLLPAPCPRRFARALRRWSCALGMVFCLAPGLALADGRLAPAEEEATAPVPFQLPAASASASLEGTESLGLPLLLVLLSVGLVGGTLTLLFRSLAQRDAVHPAPSQRW